MALKWGKHQKKCKRNEYDQKHSSPNVVYFDKEKKRTTNNHVKFHNLPFRILALKFAKLLRTIQVVDGVERNTVKLRVCKSHPKLDTKNLIQ